MNDTPRPARRRKIVIGYCISIAAFLTLNTLYCVLVEDDVDLALATPIAPLAFCYVGLVVLIPLLVSMAISLRKESTRRWVYTTHKLLLAYYLMCIVAGQIVNAVF